MTPLVWRKKTLFLHDFYVMQPLFWLSTIAQESQQSALRGRVFAFYRIAPCLNKYLHPFETHCSYLSLFNPNHEFFTGSLRV